MESHRTLCRLRTSRKLLLRQPPSPTINKHEKDLRMAHLVAHIDQDSDLHSDGDSNLFAIPPTCGSEHGVRVVKLLFRRQQERMAGLGLQLH